MEILAGDWIVYLVYQIAKRSHTCLFFSIFCSHRFVLNVLLHCNLINTLIKAMETDSLFIRIKTNLKVQFNASKHFNRKE